MIAFEFIVEFILDHPPSRAIVGTFVTPPTTNWGIGPSTTIGGFPVQALSFSPRALTSEGVPRLDLIAFQLTRRDHCKQFRTGQRVLLEHLIEVAL